MPLIIILFTFCLELQAYVTINVPMPEHSGSLVSVNKFDGKDGKELAKIIAKDLAKTSEFTSLYYDTKFDLLELTKDQIEYLLVGDSYTHGSCVNRPNDIGSVLRTLSNKSVLNLGYRGNGPLIEYATLREYLTSKVKKVLWVYSANDIRNLSDEKNEKFLLNYLNDKNFIQNLRLKQNEIDNKLKNHLEKRIERLKNIDKKSVLKEFLKIYNLRTLIFKKKETSEISLLEFKEILLLAQDLTKKNNSEL